MLASLELGHDSDTASPRPRQGVSSCGRAMGRSSLRRATPLTDDFSEAKPMITRPLGKKDYDHIIQIIDRWWGRPVSALAHPLFFYELGALARVVEHDGILVGFLLGFVAPGPPKTGYVHLVGVHPDYRRRGVGKVLYQTFEEECRAQACVRLKSVANTANDPSLAFHRALGWSPTVVEDYAGPARPRFVFQKNF